MTSETSVQNQNIRKGFGLGLAAVMLGYAGLAAWAQISGPTTLQEREERLVSSTVIIERVLPMNRELLAQPPLDDAATAVPVEAEPAQAAHEAEKTPEKTTEKTPEETSKEVAPETPKEAHTEPEKETASPAIAEPPAKGVDPQLKGLATLPNGLYAAPVDGLYEDAAQGRLPVRKADGLTAFKAYKRPAVLDSSKPVISIAVQDMGLSDQLTASAIKNMPPEVSLIISPYATALDTWAKDARADGHEIWLSLPMESQNYPRVDTGPHTLLVGAPERENLSKLEWVMSRTSGYVGLVAPYQDTFIDTQNDARPMLGNIYKRGLGFIDGRGNGSLAQTMAESMNAPYSNVNVWIDKPDMSVETINASLRQLETMAREGGFAAGVISANAVSLREVGLWLSTLKDKGFVLAPLSAQTGI